MRARLSSRVGEVSVPVEVSDEVAPGVVSLPHGWGHAKEGVELRIARLHAGASINEVTDDARVDHPQRQRCVQRDAGARRAVKTPVAEASTRWRPLRCASTVRPFFRVERRAAVLGSVPRFGNAAKLALGGRFGQGAHAWACAGNSATSNGRGSRDF